MLLLDKIICSYLQTVAFLPGCLLSSFKSIKHLKTLYVKKTDIQQYVIVGSLLCCTNIGCWLGYYKIKLFLMWPWYAWLVVYLAYLLKPTNSLPLILFSIYKSESQNLLVARLWNWSRILWIIIVWLKHIL